MNIDVVPFGVFFLVTTAIVMIAIEAGFRFGESRHRKSPDEKESPVSAMAGAILGLGAFLLAFTFGIVSNRYDARKELVREEANAIRTAWHRFDLLPEADRAKARALLHDYTAKRVDPVLAGDVEAAAGTLPEAGRIQNEMWAIVMDNARKDMNSDYVALCAEAINDVISLHAQRVAVGLQARVPTGIWLLLLAITLLGMLAVGYQMGVAGSKRTMAGPILALAFALVIELIASLDRPNSFLISVSQDPIVDVREMMNTQRGQPAR